MRPYRILLAPLLATAFAFVGCGAPELQAGEYDPAPPHQFSQPSAEELLVAGCDEASIAAAAPASAATFLKHAWDWVDRAVPYCQCVTTPSAPYRADCSGFVSYIWGLPAPGHTTHSFAGGPYDDGASVAIAWSDLTIGDALNFGNSTTPGVGHIMLFGGWTDTAHTQFCAIEEYNTGHPASITMHSTSDPGSWWGGTGTLGSEFLPTRLAGYVPTPVDTATVAIVNAPSEMVSGELATATVELTNTGVSGWDPTTTRLETSQPAARPSVFFDAARWIDPAHPVSVATATPPGAGGRFAFTLLAPSVTHDMQFVEHFGAVVDGAGAVGLDRDVTLTITVHPGSEQSPAPVSPASDQPPQGGVLVGACTAAPGGVPHDTATLLGLALIAALASLWRKRGPAAPR